MHRDVFLNSRSRGSRFDSCRTSWGAPASVVASAGVSAVASQRQLVSGGAWARRGGGGQWGGGGGLERGSPATSLAWDATEPGGAPSLDFPQS